VAGIDISADQLRRAQERVGRNVRLVRGDASALPFSGGRFDAVVSMFSHTDVDDFDKLLREAARVLRPGAPLSTRDFTPASSVRTLASLRPKMWRCCTRATGTSAATDEDRALPPKDFEPRSALYTFHPESHTRITRCSPDARAIRGARRGGVSGSHRTSGAPVSHQNAALRVYLPIVSVEGTPS
jgi:SAM-dependent methyltransferase